MMKIDVVELKIERTYQIEVNIESEYVYGIEEAKKLFINSIGDNNIEKVGVLSLDSTFKVINYSIVAMGKISSVKVSISQILRTALASNADRILIGHNHPSGVLEVTSNDIDMTQKIGNIAKWLDIQLIDSIVVNNKEALSIRKKIEESENE